MESSDEVEEIQTYGEQFTHLVAGDFGLLDALVAELVDRFILQMAKIHYKFLG